MKVYAGNMFINAAGHVSFQMLQDDGDPLSELAKQMAEQLKEAVKEASEEFRKAYEEQAGVIADAKYSRVRVVKGGGLRWFEWLVPDVYCDTFEFRVGYQEQQYFRVSIGNGKMEVLAANGARHNTVRSVETSRLKAMSASGIRLLPLLALGHSLAETARTAAGYSKPDKQLKILQAYEHVFTLSIDANSAGVRIGELTKEIHDSPYSLYAGCFGSMGSGLAEAVATLPQEAKNRIVSAIRKTMQDIEANR